MHAVLHDATGACQLDGVSVPDAAATVGLTASDDASDDAKYDDAQHDVTIDDAEHDVTNGLTKHDVANDDAVQDAIATMSLRRRLADYAATAVTIHVQPNGHDDSTHVLTATCILDRSICVVPNNELTCHRV